MLIALGCTFKYVLDGSTGQELRKFKLTTEDLLYYSPSTGRVFVSDQDLVVSALDAQADTLAGVVPLGAPVNGLVVDAVNNKFYFRSQYQPYMSRVGIVDCSTNKVKSYSRVLGWSHCLAYNSRDAKLYCSADSSIFVFDCRADTLAKEIPIDGIPCELVWYPNLNKLYAVSIFRDSVLRMNVVECSRDTVVKVLDLDPIDGGLMLPVPEFNQLWIFSQGSRYGVIDCLTDSIVGDTTNDGGNFWSVCYSPVDRKVYAAQNGGLYVMDMDTRLPVESIPMPSPYTESYLACCAARAGKVYWTVMRTYPQVELCAQAVDTRRDSIVSSSVVPNWSNGMCEDHTGDYVYIASNWLVVIDTHNDSIVSGVDLSLQTEFLVRNSATNRFYIAGLDDNVIQVVYDSIVFAGVRSEPSIPRCDSQLQTVVRRVSPVRSPTGADLYDALGRRVAVLAKGPNDIRGLSPGVYFVREARAQAVWKVIVAK